MIFFSREVNVEERIVPSRYAMWITSDSIRFQVIRDVRTKNSKDLYYLEYKDLDHDDVASTKLSCCGRGHRKYRFCGVV